MTSLTGPMSAIFQRSPPGTTPPGPTMWIAVGAILNGGSNSRYFTSDTNGAVWSGGVAPPFLFPGGSSMVAIDYDGIKWITVGQNGVVGDKVALSSDDGVSWTTISGVLPLDGILKAIVGTGLLWVIGGNAGGIATSPTGSVWTTQVSPFPSSVNGIAYNGVNLFTAVGDGLGVGTGVATSPDGVTWTSRISGSPDTFFSVAHDQVGQWIICGQNNNLQTSPDGITWTPQITPLAFDLNAVAHNGLGLWTVVGQSVGGSSQIATSPDGVTWTQRTAATPLELKSIDYGGGLWIAVGDQGGAAKAYTSTDGITWTLRDFSVTSVLYGVAHKS